MDRYMTEAQKCSWQMLYWSVPETNAHACLMLSMDKWRSHHVPAEERQPACRWSLFQPDADDVEQRR